MAFLREVLSPMPSLPNVSFSTLDVALTDPREAVVTELPHFADVSQVLSGRHSDRPVLALCPGRLHSRLLRIRENFTGEILYRPAGPIQVFEGLRVLEAASTGCRLRLWRRPSR